MTATFNPPTEFTVSNVTFDVPAIWNRLMRFYPQRPRGRAVWKLPNVDETTADAYTFDQPYPWIEADLIARGNMFPSVPDPPSGLGTGDSNLKLPQTIDKVFYGGHVFSITANEVTGLSAFLTANGYNPADWIT